MIYEKHYSVRLSIIIDTAIMLSQKLLAFSKCTFHLHTSLNFYEYLIPQILQTNPAVRCSDVCICSMFFFVQYEES